MTRMAAHAMRLHATGMRLGGQLHGACLGALLHMMQHPRHLAMATQWGAVQMESVQMEAVHWEAVLWVVEWAGLMG